MAVSVDCHIVASVVDQLEAETSGVDVTVTPDQECAKDWLGQKIQDTVEDSLGVRRNDVTTLANTPCNRVENPEESGQ